jgi:hypothetical protein
MRSQPSAGSGIETSAMLVPLDRDRPRHPSKASMAAIGIVSRPPAAHRAQVELALLAMLLLEHAGDLLGLVAAIAAVVRHVPVRR